MPKRKRSAEASLQALLETHQAQVCRALKLAKGFERQRLSKRSRDVSVPTDKLQRLELEIAVLKSLDLHQTARAHLTSSLLKVKSIAASNDLTAELRAGVPKPDLPEDERTALHNVTSGLYNRLPVKQAMDRAIAAVCGALNVDAPGKTKPSQKGKRVDEEKQPSGQKSYQSDTEHAASADSEHLLEEESEFDGFETDTDVDEPGPAIGDEPDSEAEAIEEAEFSKHSHLLGGSSDEGEEENFDEVEIKRLKGMGRVDADDISLPGSASDVESGHEFASPSHSPPRPTKRKKKDMKKTQTAAQVGPVTDSTFLPSLMGGYISGSESASEIDEARPKKRRGQRARQAIWEKKYGASAKHLRTQEQKGGRDAGWDMRRGAVDGESQGRKTPWKMGIHNPSARNSNSGRLAGRDGPARKPDSMPTKKDDQGPLHPSWEAKKKAQPAKRGVAFSGQKTVFD